MEMSCQRVAEVIAGLSTPAVSLSSVPLSQGPHGNARLGGSSDKKGFHCHSPLSRERLPLGPDGTARLDSEATWVFGADVGPWPPQPTLPGPCSSGPAVQELSK